MPKWPCLLLILLQKNLSYNVMHKRLGHSTVRVLKQVLKHFDHTLTLDNNITPDFYSACQFGKSHATLSTC